MLLIYEYFFTIFEWHFAGTVCVFPYLWKSNLLNYLLITQFSDQRLQQNNWIILHLPNLIRHTANRNNFPNSITKNLANCCSSFKFHYSLRQLQLSIDHLAHLIVHVGWFLNHIANIDGKCVHLIFAGI